MRRCTLVLALLLLPFVAHAADPVVTVCAGVNGVFVDDNAKPSDFEGGGTLSASLSPHIALVGSAFYGFNHSYLTGSAGVRSTITDVSNPNFSIGVGFQYRASSEPNIRPEGFGPDVTIGWRPYPERWPAVTVGAQAGYVMDSNEASLILAGRYDLGIGGAR